MANDEIKFLPIFQILDIKNIWFLLELEMALATAIKKMFEPVWVEAENRVLKNLPPFVIKLCNSRILW